MASSVLAPIESICASIFPDLLSEYHRLYPEVTISIVTDSPDVLLNRMNENAIDIVYLLDRRIYDSRWCKTLEEPEENIFVASPDHELVRANRELELDEVLRFPVSAHRKRCQLPSYVRTVSGIYRPFYPAVSGNRQYRIHYSHASKKYRDLVSAGIYHPAGSRTETADRA